MKSLLLWALCVSLCPSLTHATTYYFSSSSGNDARSATQATSSSTPWKSISKLNSFFANLKPGDVIRFKRGDTFFGTIRPSRSGTASAPITIGAYGSGSKPVITGFVTLSNWTSIGNGRYERYNASLGSTVNMVTLDGVNQELGRHPNSSASYKGYLFFESHGTNSITDNQLPSSPNWTGAELVVRSHRYALDRLKVTGHSGGKLTYKPAADYELKNNFGYFLQNDVRTLDKLGEWAYKASTKKLYMYFGSRSPANYPVKATALGNLVHLYGKKNIIFDNLSFQGANGHALNVDSSAAIKIRNCEILFSGINAVNARLNTGLVVENCTIANTNNIGIYVYVESYSTIIRNNVIKNTGVFAGMCQTGANTSVAVRDNSNNSVIEYNTIENTGYTGIRFIGDNILVKNNFINKFAFVKDDAGGIYTGSANKLQRFGRKIIGNIILNGLGAIEGTSSRNSSNAVRQVSGIYIDLYASGIEVRDNTMANCGKAGIFAHNAYKLTIRNNTCFNNTQGQMQLVHDHTGPRITNVVMKNNIFVSKTATQYVAFFYTNLDKNDINAFGSIDSNYYARPVNDNLTIRTITGLYTSSQHDTYHTLSTWKSAYIHDDHSKKSPKALSSSVNLNDYLLLVYNATKQSKFIALSGTYIDMKNKSYSNGITLTPYASAVLLKVNQTSTVQMTSPAANDINMDQMALSEETSMESNHSSVPTFDVRLYPNPVVNKLYIELKGAHNNQQANLIIYNLAGSVEKNIPVTLSGSIIQVDVASLVPGMYVLSLVNQNLKMEKKFLKID